MTRRKASQLWSKITCSFACTAPSRRQDGRRGGRSPGSWATWRSTALPARREKTIASRRELDARRFAPWTPVEATSPHA